MTAQYSTQLLSEFEKELERQRELEQTRSQAIIPADDGEDTELTVSPRRSSFKRAIDIDEYFKPAKDELATATAELVSEGAEDIDDSMQLYRAICLQGDYLDRRRRSESLRNANRARRKVHAAARRRAHSVEGGLLQRRLRGEILELLERR